VTKGESIDAVQKNLTYARECEKLLARKHVVRFAGHHMCQDSQSSTPHKGTIPPVLIFSHFQICQTEPGII
jgi:hypothetical protein